MIGAIDLVCPEYVANIGGKLRTPAKPCGLFCNTPDFRYWRAEALQRIKNALIARQDVPGNYLEYLRNMQAKIQDMSESVFSVGEDTRWLAQVASDAHCILYSAPGVSLPPITEPKRPENPVNELANKALIVGGLGLAFWIYLNAKK